MNRVGFLQSASILMAAGVAGSLITRKACAAPPAKPAAPEKKNDEAKAGADMVDLATFDPAIQIDIKWAGKDNMLGRAVYAQNRCFLRREAAEALSRARGLLEARQCGLRVWEGYRPMWMQQYLWDEVGDPDLISDPSAGRRTHIRGIAIDVTLLDAAGRELTMPTKYCEFSKREQMKHSYRDLPAEILERRQILRDAMAQAGFEIYEHEWWHYNLPAWKEFDLLDERELVPPAAGIRIPAR